MKHIFLVAILISNLNVSAQVIAGGGRHSIAICSDSIVWTWGTNSLGELGNGTNTDSNIPTQVSSLTSIIKTAEGVESHSLALKMDKTVWAWGDNTYGQLGNGNNTNSNTPIQVNLLTNTDNIAGGYGHSLALKNDGTVWSWGYNLNGQLGNGNNTSSNIPAQINSLNGVTKIAGRQYHSLALKNDSTVWSWGYNGTGQLGNGNNTDSNIPVQVSSLTGIIDIAAGWGHSLALKSDGTVWAWGYNLKGTLGNGSNIATNIPIQVSSITDIVDIAAGGGHSLALKNDGTVWSWGDNLNGQLGNGNNIDSNVPIQVNSISGITTIASGGDSHSLALKSDGSLWTWGINGFGQLGNGNNTDSNIPVQVTGLCDVIATNEDEIKSQIDISIFPNPSNGFYHLTYYNISLVKYNLEIYNVIGDRVLQQQSVNELDISNFPKGIYFLKLIVDGNVIIKKIIKN